MELSDKQLASLVYHDQYDYPMTERELVKWQLPMTKFKSTNIKYGSKKEYFFLKGREKIVAVRQKREVASAKKLQILKKYSPIFQRIPSILFVGVTGSLAMHNSDPGSDIDLMVITKKNSLWLARLITLISLITLKIPLRRAGNKEEKDKLCLNLWLDETALVWPAGVRNAFTAHEIAQVVPVINKRQTYERFLSVNRWILNYWPRSVVSPNNFLRGLPAKAGGPLCKILNFCAYKAQLWYMKPKITNEVISVNRALFHPQRRN